MPSAKFRISHVVAFAAALFAAPVITSARAVTTDNFLVRTTADYVALCETARTDANYVAAVHFCQGFASGAYQYYVALSQAAPAERFVCFSDPAPSRDEAIASFLVWARAHPDQMSKPAVDSIFRYLGETYPCSEAQRAQH